MAVQELGICITCNNVGFCMHRRRHNQAVWYCNEFDDFTPRNGGFRLRSAEMRETAEAVKEETGQFKGLCANCEKRHFCQFPKSEGGVWHCEEYE